MVVLNSPGGNLMAGIKMGRGNPAKGLPNPRIKEASGRASMLKQLIPGIALAVTLAGAVVGLVISSSPSWGGEILVAVMQSPTGKKASITKWSRPMRAGRSLRSFVVSTWSGNKRCR